MNEEDLVEPQIIGSTDVPVIPFDKTGQKAIFGKLLVNSSIGEKALLKLTAKNFIDENMQELFTILQASIKKYQCFPSAESFKSAITFLKKDLIKNDVIFDYEKLTDECIKLSYKYDDRVILKTLSDWLQALALREVIIKGGEFLRDRNIEALPSLLHTGIRQAQDQAIDNNDRYDIANVEQDFLDLQEQETNGITTGIDLLDKDLGGCLAKKTHTILIGSSNSGKSAWAINIAYHNVIKNKKVLFISHEGQPLDIITKLRQRFLRMRKDELVKAYLTPNGRIAIKAFSQALAERLVYRPFNKASGMFIEDVIVMIKHENELEKTKTGRGFDLIIDDYPKKLSSREKKGAKEARFPLAYVYEQFNQLSIELNCHIISPAQLNREGVKQNKTRQKEEEFVTSDNISESHEIYQDATNVLVLNRSTDDEFHNRMYVVLDKSRTGPKNIVYKVNTDFDRCITHDKSLGFSKLTDKYGVQKNTLTSSSVEAILRKNAVSVKNDETAQVEPTS